MGQVKDVIARDREQKAWEMRTQQGASIYTIATKLGVTPQAVSAMLKRVGNAIHKQMASTIEAQKIEQSMQLDKVIEEAFAAWIRSQDDAEKSTMRRKAIGVTKESQEPQGHGGSLTRNEAAPLPDIEEFDPESVPYIYTDENGDEVPTEVRLAKVSAAAVEWAREKLAKDIPLFKVEELTTNESKGQVGDPRFLDQIQKALDAKREIWGLDAPKPDAPGATVVVKVYEGIDLSKEV